MRTSTSATRLTCFAIISAIEDDLRAYIRTECVALNHTNILPADVRDSASRRWDLDNSSNTSARAGSDVDLLPYIDFVDLAKILHGLRKQLNLTADAAAIAKALEPLAPTRNRVCHTRPLEPGDLSLCLDSGGGLCGAAPGIFTSLSDALRRLSQDPRFVLGLQIPSFWSPVVSIPHNLPLPEFDDTGFLGRDNDRRQVLTLIKSHYPVVTIVGEGGVGKTALLVRCLYDLVDQVDAEYDLVVWTSLKTKTLTSFGLSEINDAIGTTIGLLGSLAGALATPKTGDLSEEELIDEIVSCLRQFRVLVAIDNLETISGDTLRSLLLRLPKGSKILITSRVGLGEFETRYALGPFDRGTAAQLMRRSAATVGLTTLSQADDGLLRKYCERLFDNALLIKWFVAGVSRGLNPQSLLKRDGDQFTDALAFCFSNLFEHLGDVERSVIDTLASAGRPLSAAELAFLCEHLQPHDLEWALGALHNSSIVRRPSASGDRSGHVTYQLSEPARAYIASAQAPSKDSFTLVQQRLQTLRRMAEHEGVTQATYKYEIFSVRAASRDERIAAVYLRQALNELNQGRFDEARARVATAKALLPSYAEAFRIASLVESRDGKIFRAAEELEQARQLAPNSPLVRYCYAQFLLRELEDFDSALEQLLAADRLDPGDPAILGAKALVLTRLGRYRDAASIYETLIEAISERPRRWRVSTFDQAAECYRRWAEVDDKNRDAVEFSGHMTRALQILSLAVASGDVDQHTANRVARVLDQCVAHAAMLRDPDHLRASLPAFEALLDGIPGRRLAFKNQARVVESCASWPDIAERVEAMCQARSTGFETNEDAPESTADSTIVDASVFAHGVVDTLPIGLSYGFVRDSRGRRWFFHRSAMARKEDWLKLRPGMGITFQVGSNEQGPCAIGVEPVAQAPLES